MDISLVMNAMRDASGVPAHPVIFQLLMVFTWIFHIAFVHLTLGAGAMAIWAFIKRTDPNWEQLSIAMTKVAKVSVSMAVVLGVAPLLFTQVIYDPQWYFANIISATWVIGFIFTLIVGYSLWFVFYYQNHKGAKSNIVSFAVVGLGLMIFDGFIMHVLSYQSLLPDQWMTWYAPNGKVDNSGNGIHAYQWQRYAYIISLSIIMLGAYLMAYADYFRDRSDKSGDYLTWAYNMGARIATVGLVLSIPFLCLWYIDLPVHVANLTDVIFALLIVFSLGGVFFFASQRNARFGFGYQAIAVYGGMIAILAILREAVRMAYLNPFGYDIMTYKVVEDLPSTALFFLTLIGVGGSVAGFYLTMLYKSGKTVGLYTADSTVSRLGTAANVILILWIAIFFAVGIWTWLGNMT